MTSLRVICGLGPPPIKNPGYAYGGEGHKNDLYVPGRRQGQKLLKNASWSPLNT